MLRECWKRQELPGVDGLIRNTGEFYTFENYVPVPEELPKNYCFESVAVLEKLGIYNSTYELVCGEANSFGSFGFIAMVNKSNNEPLWALFSSRSNPFYEIIEAGPYFVVVSTSGAIFRFNRASEKMFLSLP